MQLGVHVTVTVLVSDRLIRGNITVHFRREEMGVAPESERIVLNVRYVRLALGAFTLHTTSTACTCHGYDGRILS